ncbi:MAG: hypothetical protein KGY81_09995 [Phycisphaerae bacterium]|nr:hypothetical protein [Phycisphaerae bacterium]
METRAEPTVADLACMEARIAATLNETADELAHAECFDQEQRAEIYAILQAIRNDTSNHRTRVDLLAAKLGQGAEDV